jgi:hypothetical protein
METPPPRGVGGGVMSSLQKLQRVRCGQEELSAGVVSTLCGRAHSGGCDRDEHE